VTQCAAIARSGAPCRGYVHPGREFCPSHDPDRVEARRRSASKAGRSRGGSEIHDIKATLKDLAAGVLEGEVDRGNASVVGQLYGLLLRSIEVERKLKETDELEGRLKALEARLEPLGPTTGGRRWG
jgi:hypothetical protein